MSTLIGYVGYTGHTEGGSEMVPFFFVAGVIFVLLMGPFVLKAYWPHWKSRSWEFAFGIVQEVSVAEGPRPGGDPDQTWYWVDLRYSYRAKGRGYKGTRIGAKREYTQDREKAKVLAAHYRPDEKVRVHFDPKDPATAMLKKPGPPEAINLLVLGLVLAVVSALIAWFVMDLLPPEVLEFFQTEYE
jgi:hypothetical protein